MYVFRRKISWLLPSCLGKKNLHKKSELYQNKLLCVWKMENPLTWTSKHYYEIKREISKAENISRSTHVDKKEVCKKRSINHGKNLSKMFLESNFIRCGLLHLFQWHGEVRKKYWQSEVTTGKKSKKVLRYTGANSTD